MCQHTSDVFFKLKILKKAEIVCTTLPLYPSYLNNHNLWEEKYDRTARTKYLLFDIPARDVELDSFY